jgi:DNA-binding MarR family transcriptional regulator
MTLNRDQTISTSRDLSNVCHPTHPAVVAWVDLQRFLARSERLLGAALRHHGLNRGQLAVLLTVGADEGLTQQELADRLALTKANVSQLLDRMEAAGLVRRVPEARAYALHLTQESRELLRAVVPEQEQLIIEQFSDLSQDEQQHFRQLVGRLASD